MKKQGTARHRTGSHRQRQSLGALGVTALLLTIGASTALGGGVISHVAARPKVAPHRSHRSAGYSAKVAARNARLHTGIKLVPLPCARAHHQRSIFATVDLVTRSGPATFVEFIGGCYHKRAHWSAEFGEGRNRIGEFSRLAVGDRVAVRAKASSDHRNSLVVADRSDGRKRRIAGPPHRARRLNLAVQPLDFTFHHRVHHSPLVNFRRIRYGPTTLNGRGLAALKPTGRDLYAHGRLRVKTSKIRKRSFALTYRHR
jgi:hypothetical protein